MSGFWSVVFFFLEHFDGFPWLCFGWVIKGYEMVVWCKMISGG